MRNDWEKRVIGWAAERNILGGSSPDKQLEKLKEEFGELCDAMDACDMEEVMDAIGDMSVVLAIITNMYGMNYEECMEAAWVQIKDRKGRLVGGVFVKEENL